MASSAGRALILTFLFGLLPGGACRSTQAFRDQADTSWCCGACVVASPSLAAGDALPESVELPTLTPESRCCPSRASRVEAGFCEAKCKLWTDYGHFYTGPDLQGLLLGIGGASILANTSLDRDFQGWYQDDARSSGTDRWAEIVRPLGNGWYVIPACVGLGIAGAMFDETSCGTAIGQFGGRASRAYAVGAPPMLFLQSALGSSRPDEPPHDSRWRPFNDANAVSGHAFVGAVPFITAAKMTDDPCLKGGLYACSLLPAWSRMNDDSHYLSQALLGWWIAYLACDAVGRTDGRDGPFTFTPVAMPGGFGVGIVYER